MHGKGSLIDKMPGDRWQKFANLRCLYAFMWAHPGKQLLFMGQEFAQWQEWSHARSLDWHLLDEGDHAGVQALVRELNHVQRELPALFERDDSGEGFAWLEPNDADGNVLIFARFGRDPEQDVAICACNLSPVPRPGYRIGLPRPGTWTVALDTDDERFGGSSAFAGQREIASEDIPWHNQRQSAAVDLPPLGVRWLVPA